MATPNSECYWPMNNVNDDMKSFCPFHLICSTLLWNKIADNVPIINYCIWILGRQTEKIQPVLLQNVLHHKVLLVHALHIHCTFCCNFFSPCFLPSFLVQAFYLSRVSFKLMLCHVCMFLFTFQMY